MPGNGRPDEASEPLRFPVPPEPLLDHPPATIDMILAASEEMLPVWNADPQREEKRLALKCHERFVLTE
jgi:hypothetical protein